MKTKLLGEDPRSTALVLEPGDEAVSAIENWVRDEGVKAASLTAIGGFEACMLGSSRAGHLMSGKVRPTLEVVVNSAPAHLRCKMDAESGLPLIEP